MRWLDRIRGWKPQAAPAADPMAEALAAAQAGDYDTALGIWEPLARAGNGRAQNNIGACFAEGLGVPADRGLALKWLRLAAEAGDPVGERNYAAFHMQGLTGMDADYGIAAEYYQRAAEKGDAPAQDMLSWMLLEGEVMAPDLHEARLWAERAAEAGIASSMTRLGMLYHHALGVDRDPEMAVAWWTKGAVQGDADAQAMLGAACYMGAGTVRDGVAALAWLLRASGGGSTLATPFVGPVRASLSVAEIDEAERRATEPLAGCVP
ncbi:sel1 repeat family protein [Rhizobiaceae bacterium n13]|uniref:Sel1 repeat family protein n=1 Tax=Ferirhizobium litorale TaxID=2927786 RepID=A0AAE3QAZ9_9HYPH|nr:tetratricopeptide repeat protein [Fererhizobium litorale]MDI7860355.1 sel1 repeat family protein [Fererhizobium litorale]MDI7920490.1 sel1 repeat family protein [Fererhizobium litorale]